jgi:hypothetical protein
MSSREADTMAQWAKEDLAKGKITQAQADGIFAELNTPLEARVLVTKSPEQKNLEQWAPDAKPGDYRIAYGVPGQEAEMTPEIKQFDETARTWMSTAGMPRDLGNSLVNQIAKVAQQTERMSPDELLQYGYSEYEKLQRVHGNKLDERLHSAAKMIDVLEQQRPGLKSLLKSQGLGDSAIVANMLIAHAPTFHAKQRR